MRLDLSRQHTFLRDRDCQSSSPAHTLARFAAWGSFLRPWPTPRRSRLFSSHFGTGGPWSAIRCSFLYLSFALLPSFRYREHTLAGTAEPPSVPVEYPTPKLILQMLVLLWTTTRRLLWITDAVDTTKRSILRIAKDVCSHTSRLFILVDGASLHGSTRNNRH